MKKIILFLVLLSVANCAYPWSCFIHQIIAQIAYDNLQPKAKAKVKQLTHVLAKTYPRYKTYLSQACLADVLKDSDLKSYRNWHYINIPYGLSDDIPRSIPTPNISWGISRLTDALKNNKLSERQQATDLALLTHFVGDIHQPMHTINYYVKEFLQGDRGGNLYPIKAKHADNLHQYWDQGLYFNKNYIKNYPLRANQLRKLARILQRKFPEDDFAYAIVINEPQQWAIDSHMLAQNEAYNIHKDARPSKSYVQSGQKIVESQIALAGYRLAAILNRIYNEPNLPRENQAE